MAVTIDISAEAETLLKREWSDLNRAARDALVIESYRQGKLSLGQCSEILGTSFAETEAFLRSRGVDLGVTMQDVEDDLNCLRKALK